MRILFLSNRVPFPPTDGGTVGIYQACTSIVNSETQVDFFSLNPSRNPYQAEHSKDEFKRFNQVHIYDINTELSASGALKNILYNTSYHITRFYNQSVAESLRKHLKNNTYDLIHFDGLQITAYLDIVHENSEAACVMRAANVEHKIWESLANQASFGLKKWYLKHAAKQLKKYELQTVIKFDGLICVSIEDLEYFKSIGFYHPIHIAYTGFDEHKISESTLNDISVYHIASMDWIPNIEGLRWFLKDIWPKVHQQVPHCKLHLAGKNMGDEFYQYSYLNVINHGQVADAYQFISDKAILVIPLKSGSGMRVKTIEAMAMGKAIVGTTLAAQGLPEDTKSYMRLSNNADTFANELIALIQDRDAIQKLGMESRQYAIKHFEIKQIAKDTLAYYQEIIKLSKQ